MRIHSEAKINEIKKLERTKILNIYVSRQIKTNKKIFQKIKKIYFPL